jgi:uncharacterized protein YkwD
MGPGLARGGRDPLAMQLEQSIARWFANASEMKVLDDPSLGAVAQQNSQALAEMVSAQVLPGSSYLRFLLGRNQVYDAVFLAAAFRSAQASSLPQQVEGFLRARAAGGEWTHLGVGVAQGPASTTVVTVLLARRRVHLTQVKGALGQPVSLCAQILSGRDPRVLMTAPSGRVLERTPRVNQGHFCARLPTAGPGSYQVEIMIDGPYGPEVTTLFPLYIGVLEPDLPVEKIYPPESREPALVEARLLVLINQSRRQQSLAPLSLRWPLVHAARTHSHDMLDSGFFGHRSPRRGSLDRRLAAEDLASLDAAENLAIATSPANAHDALMNSPSHRKIMLDPKMTHVGIGVALSREQELFYVTECFAQAFSPEE